MEGAERQPEVGKEGLDWRDSSERSRQGLAWGTRPRWSEGARQAWARPWMGRAWQGRRSSHGHRERFPCPHRATVASGRWVRLRRQPWLEEVRSQCSLCLASHEGRHVESGARALVRLSLSLNTCVSCEVWGVLGFSLLRSAGGE